MAANDVSINISGNPRGAQEALGAVRKDMGKVKGSTADVTRGFKEMATNIGLGSISAMSMAFSFSKLMVVGRGVKQGQAQINLIVAGFGPAARNALKKMEPEFKAIGRQFGVTEKEVRKAYGIILKESKDPIVSIQSLRAALGLAATGADSLEGSSKRVGLALFGNVKTLEELLPYIGDLDEAFALLAKEGEQTVPALVKLRTVALNWLDDLAEGLVEMKPKWKEHRESIKAVRDEIVGLPGNVVTAVKFEGTTDQFILGMFGDSGKYLHGKLVTALSFESTLDKTVTGFFSVGGGWLKDQVVTAVKFESTLDKTVTGFFSVGGVWLKDKLVTAITFKGERDDAVKGFFSDAGGWLKDKLVTAVTFKGERDELVKGFFDEYGKPIGQTVGSAFSWTLGDFTTAATKFFKPTTGTPKGQTVGSAFSWTLGDFTTAATRFFKPTTGIPKGQTVGAVFSWALGKFPADVGRFFSYVGAPIKQTVKVNLDFIKGAVFSVGAMVAGIVDDLKSEFKSLMPGWLKRIFGVDAASTEGESGEYAVGALPALKRPTFSGIGLGAVASLGTGSTATSGLALAGASTSINHYTINVTGNLIVDDDSRAMAVAEELAELLSQKARRGITI